MRKAFAETMVNLARRDDKLVVLIGDISHYLLKDFEREFPDRFYNAGICEQAIIGMAAGLAMEGYRPVVHTIAPFCVERAYEQIKVDLCYQELDVTIVSVGASFDYAHLGCTHHCYEDISILRPLPGIDLFVPGTSTEFRQLIGGSWANGRPKYFKLSKTEHGESFNVEAYECRILNRGRDGVLIVNGPMLREVLRIPKVEKYTIIYCPTVEPISTYSQELIAEALEGHSAAVVVEENSSSGAFADKIFDIASANNIRSLIKKVGIPRQFCTNYGSADDHRREIGLTRDNIANVLKEALDV